MKSAAGEKFLCEIPVSGSNHDWKFPLEIIMQLFFPSLWVSPHGKCTNESWSGTVTQELAHCRRVKYPHSNKDTRLYTTESVERYHTSHIIPWYQVADDIFGTHAAFVFPGSCVLLQWTFVETSPVFNIAVSWISEVKEKHWIAEQKNVWTNCYCSGKFGQISIQSVSWVFPVNVKISRATRNSWTAVEAFSTSAAHPWIFWLFLLTDHRDASTRASSNQEPPIKWHVSMVTR